MKSFINPSPKVRCGRCIEKVVVFALFWWRVPLILGQTFGRPRKSGSALVNPASVGDGSQAKAIGTMQINDD